MDLPMNHEEAGELARMKSLESNLARCYLDFQAKNKELRIEIEGYKRQIQDWYGKLQGTDANWKDAVLRGEELTEKCAALAQTIHDLRDHVGSFPICVEEPCYSAWLAVKQSRRAEKPFELCPPEVCPLCYHHKDDEAHKVCLSLNRKIVCICGSTRFLDDMAVAAWEMEKKGILVVGPHLLPASYPGVKASHQAEEEGVREILDELHLRKIDLCDEVFVVNPGGHFGSSTRNELRYARSKGKPIRFMVPVEADSL
jgi:hypothetical protein